MVDALAVASYANVAGADDPGQGQLNLTWTLDEREHLACDLVGLLRQELQDELGDASPYLYKYMVRDPYGEAELGPAVEHYFEGATGGTTVTCGAGVGPLLHALSSLAHGGTVFVASNVYPDFPYWVKRAGGHLVGAGFDGALDGPLEPDWVIAAAQRALAEGARLVFLERPDLLEDAFAALPQVARLCALARRFDAWVLVDESNANYETPAYSAATLVAEQPNLFVLRGLSKAYGLGGLRIGWCVAHPDATHVVRKIVPPLLASSLSLRLAARVLNQGDVGAPLRARITASKATAARLLDRWAADEWRPATGHIPYLLHPGAHEAARERLRQRGVLTKAHPYWSTTHGRLDSMGRLSVPLSDDRQTALSAALTGVTNVP